MQLRSEYIRFHKRKLFQNLDFSKDLFGLVIMLKDILNELDGEHLAGASMLGFNDVTKGTLS